MDEENRAGKPASGASKRDKAGRRLVRRIFTAVITLLLIAAAVFCFFYRDKLSSDGLRDLLGRTVQTQDEAPAFSYENGSDQTFALAGDGLAVASASGIQLLDKNGVTVVKEICSMDAPAVSAAGPYALFFDIGGDTCKAANTDGSCADAKVGGNIITASVSTSGSFAVISEESGSKGLVQVFDSSCQLLFKWYSGTGYALSAQVSPDGRSLAVLCLTGEGSIVHFFKLNSEEEQASIRFPGEVLFDLRYISGNRICAVGENGLYFSGTDGKNDSVFSFQGKYLSAYDFGGSGYISVYLSEYRSGGSGTLMNIDDSGALLGSADVSGDLISLSANGRQVLFATSSSLLLFSQSMQPLESSDELITAKKALLRSRDILLLSSYSAEPFSF